MNESLRADLPTSVRAAPVFVTGLSGTGKTELRRVLEVHPSLHMIRKSSAWNAALRRRDVSSAVAAAADGARRVGAARWGLQRKGLEHVADLLFDAMDDVFVVHLVRNPDAGPRKGRRPGSAGWALARWAISMRSGLRNETRWPHRYALVHSEDFADDPVGAVEAVSAFLGLAVTAEMRDLSRGMVWPVSSVLGASGTPLSLAGRRSRDAAGYSLPASTDVVWTPAGVLDLVMYCVGRAVQPMIAWRSSR